jgi:hypothetical protein
MLRIDLAQAGLASNVFEQYNLPSPINGTDTEVNGAPILLFDDEEEAVEYLDTLEDYSGGIDNDAPEKPVLNALIGAINNDEFVQAYRG